MPSGPQSATDGGDVPSSDPQSATDGVADVPAGVRTIEFALAVADPLSLDELVGWQLARPTDLWHWLDEAGRNGWIAEDTAAGSGWFAFRDEVRRCRILAGASEEDWRQLYSLPARSPLIASVLANARRAARARRLDTGGCFYRALVLFADRDAFPGGIRGWLEVVVEAIRTFRSVEWLSAGTLDEALAVALMEGDVRFQAVLAAARGFEAGRTGEAEDARAYLERAVDAARAAGDRAIEFEVYIRLAYVEAIHGRPQAALAAFERFLGDLPEELIPLPPELAVSADPLPETPLAILACIYGQLGQYGRAFDILDRLLKAGTRDGRPDLVALAQANLAVTYSGRRELEPTRVHAEPAWEYFLAAKSEPVFVWRAAVALAWARMAEGRLQEARAVLEEGNRARMSSGLAYFAGSALFEVLDRLDLEGMPEPEGLHMEAEIERMLAWSDGYMNAVARRYRARRLTRGGNDTEAGLHYTQSVEILRASAASPLELARSLEEAAAWLGRNGEADRASALEGETQRILTSVGLGPEEGRADATALVAAFAELGRLATLADRTEGVWGELAARLCAVLGAERCALLEDLDGEVRVMASRGAKEWVEAVRTMVREERPAGPGNLVPPGTEGEAACARLLAVPFASPRLSRRAWAVLENRCCCGLFAAAGSPVIEALSAQLSVFFENVTMWQELVAARRRLEQENRYYRQCGPARVPGGSIVGDSPALRRTLDLVARAAPADTAVIVLGETGVGKELVANELHRLSRRGQGPFIVVHIASLAPGLVASALFGHERGAFTGATEQARGRFELADGGTLFLDEVGELGPEDQVRILRVLQEGTFERVGGTKQLRSDFRLIAATNRDLTAEVKAGRFREDLYYRLAAFPIAVPPLRERTEEIPTLALYFMEAANRKLAVRYEGISEADMGRLTTYRWPGNVRELEHVIERAALLSDPPRLRIPPLQDAFAAPERHGPQEWTTLEEAERRYLRDLIAHTEGRITGPAGAAEIAGLKASTLNWRIQKLGLRAELQRARGNRE